MYQPSRPLTMQPHSGRTALIHGLRAGLVLGIAESALIVCIAHAGYFDNPILQLSIPLSLLGWIISLLVVSFEQPALKRLLIHG